jgi:hypothetical protein
MLLSRFSDLRIRSAAGFIELFNNPFCTRIIARVVKILFCSLVQLVLKIYMYEY